MEYLHEVAKFRQRRESLAAFFQDVIKHAADIAPLLAEALAGLALPTVTAPRQAWQDFNSELRQLLLDHRDLGRDWKFTKEQIKKLAAYFEANLLLLKCLDVADVTDREAIKNRLLLPPEESAE